MPPPVPLNPSEEEMTVTVTVDGVPFVFRPAMVSALDVSACRRATGLSVNGILNNVAQSDPDIDVIAAIVWLARRQAGEAKLDYDDVAAGFTYDTNFDVEDVAEKDTIDVGEVPAAS